MAKKAVTKVAKKTPAKASKPAANAKAATVDVFNVLQPGKTYKRNAEKLAQARKAFFGFMPAKGPGLTQSEMGVAMRNALPEFGSTAGWWMKTVQLDGEARGEVVRDRTAKPLRWRKAK
jgi:hypothetical protein